MKTMQGMALLLGVTLFAAPVPCEAQSSPDGTVRVEATAVQGSLQDYAGREAASPGLGSFAGGSGGLIVLIVVLAAALILLAILIPW